MISRRVTITGNDSDGYSWSCGTCGVGSSRNEPSRDAAWAAFDDHYTNAPSLEVEPWLVAVLDAGQALADAATAAGVLSSQVTAWSSNVAGGPPDLIATWRNHGITHPQ